MSSKEIGFGVAGVFLVLAVWWVIHSRLALKTYQSSTLVEVQMPNPTVIPAAETPPVPTPTANQQSTTSSAPGSPRPVATMTAPVADGAPTPQENAADPASLTTQAAVRNARVDADKVKLMLRDFHNILGENPVGTNAEVMHSLLGGNPKQATLGPPGGMTLNGDGELVDQWNTPYFFHQLSRDVTEIRSAGPDRKMYTADDVVIK